MSMLTRFFVEDSGASMVEYAILVSILSIAAVAIIIVVGRQVNQAFNELNQQMTNVGM